MNTSLSSFRVVQTWPCYRRAVLSAPILLASAALLLGGTREARATPVTYTLGGEFSGTLGSTSFKNELATFTFTGDTANTKDLGSGFYADTAGISTFTLNGVKTATFLSPTFGVESEFGAAAFYDFGKPFAAGVYNPGLGSYDLSALREPVNGYFVQEAGTEATSLGALFITGSRTNVTFQATAATPEPGSLLLLGTGLLGSLGVLRHRVRNIGVSPR